MDIRIYVPEANSQEVNPIFYTHYTETLFAENR